MRKVTGYIGALIVVVALMGSIMAGYALNINGQSVVVNEYENVTDVSGLYSHTDEKTYIDYNPASNYIGYSVNNQYANSIPSGGYTLKDIKSGTIVITPADMTINVNGVIINGFPTNYLNTPFMSDKSCLEGSGNTLNYYGFDGGWVNIVTPITIDINGSTTTITHGSTTHTLTNTTHNLVYWPLDDWDYIQKAGIRGGNSNPINAYIDDVNDILSAGNDGGRVYQSAGGKIYYRDDGTTTTISFEKTGTQINGSVYLMDVNYQILSFSAYGVFYPRYAYAPGTGIDYTESNRVNNYPIEYEYQENTETQTLPQIDLKNVTATNYFPAVGTRWIIGSVDLNRSYTYNDTNYINWKGNDFWVSSSTLLPYCRYSLNDIVSIMDIPIGTSQIVFDTGDYAVNEISVNNTALGGTVNTGHYVPSNFVALASSTTDYSIPMIDINYGWKAYYTISTGLVDIYTTNGVKVSTSTLANTFVQFTKYPNISGQGGATGTTTNNVVNHLGNVVWRAPWDVYDNNPYLNATAITRGIVDNTKYLDATKGVKIDPSNTSDVIWNNNYENGNIQLLIRAADTGNTYHNDLEVSGNQISVDYDGLRFTAALNDGDAVDIGTWRSIILNIDLVNGDVYAIPVRTFNSYTNVQMDNTSLFIGSMTDYTTTNTITWMPTSDSFTFSIYSTSVFMDTYGVVMKNPSLTITDYFTDLNNFYRLELSNFSIYGDSITINDRIGEVTGNRVSFGNESVIIKKLSITYADGNVYLSDGDTDIDLGEITTNYITLGGAWYFKTFLQKGYTAQKQIYTWDWQNFILDNTEFCVIYIGLVLAGLVIARKFCTLRFVDYAVLGISLIIALGVQVIA